MSRRRRTPLDRAGEAHLGALERLAQADTMMERRRALEHAVDTFEKFIDAIPKKESK